MSESGGALRELVAWLGFEVDDKGLKKGEDSLNGMIEKAKKAGEALIVGLGIEKIGEWIESQVTMGAQLEHTSEMLGVNIEDLQSFQYAAETAGVGTDEANTALRFLNRTLGEAKSGNAEAAKAFAELHVATKKADGSSRDMSDVISDVADGFVKMGDPALQTAAAMKVFGRQGAALIPLLKKGGAGVSALRDEFQKLGGGMSEQFVKDAADAHHEIIRLETAEKSLGNSLAASLLPVVGDVAEAATQVVVQLRAWTANTNIVRNTLYALTAAAVVAGVIWGIMNIEILLVVAALAVLALAVDDVITFFEGGNSVLGEFFDALGGKGTQQEVRDFFVHLWGDLKDMWNTIQTELLPALGRLWDAFTSEDGKKTVLDLKTGLKEMAGFADDMSKAFKIAVHYAAKLSDAVATVKSKLPGGDLVEQIATPNDEQGPSTGLLGALGRGLTNIAPGLVGGGGAPSIATVLQQDAGNLLPGAATGPTVTTNQTNNITVNGASDPTATGQQVKKAVDQSQADLNSAHAAVRGGG